jgi:BlaI family penicillinase repressor
MSKTKKITEAELYIMKVLWDKSPLNASQIIDELKDETQWNPKTIHTLIRRLVSKGIVRVEKATPYHLYYPLITRSEYQNNETESFINKVYNGSIHSLVSNFIKEEKLSKEELDKLRALLESKPT